MNKISEVFIKFPILETKRFILREIRLEDYNYIYEIYSDEEAVKYQQIKPMENMEQAQKAVESFLNGFKNKMFIRWCIVNKEKEDVLGTVTLHSFDIWNSKAEIGYMLNKKFWKQNVMSEAAEKVIIYAFEEINLNRIEASIDPRNIASIKLSEKLGFEKEGLKKQAAYNKRTNKYEDRFMFGRINYI